MQRYKTKCYCLVVLLSLSCFSQLATASFISSFALWKNPSSRLVTTLSMGPAWEDRTEKRNPQTFYLAPRIQKTFTLNRPTRTLFDGELFLGYQIPLSDLFLWQLGLEVAATNNTRISGNILDDADPIFGRYTYHYQIQHTHVAAAGKLLLQNSGGLLSCMGYMPWIGASLGVGFNHAYGFENTPNVSAAATTANFGSHTETSFTYTLKFGMQKIINPRWQVGANYEFADWGKTQLRRAPGQTLNSGLTKSHLYTNAILLNITYIA